MIQPETIEQVLKRVDSLFSSIKPIKERYDFNKKKSDELRRKSFSYDKSIALISHISKENLEDLKPFERVITAGLQDLFDDSYEFQFVIKQRASDIACDFAVKNSNCNEFLNIEMSRGKSIKEIIAVLVRILLINYNKRTQKILVLDEPLGGLEDERQVISSKFIKELCDKLEIQMIIVSQSSMFVESADKVIKIERNYLNANTGT